METSLNKSKKLFQMLPVDKGHGITGNIFSIGRILIGRTESCDFVIPSQIISAVHAVLEVTPKSAKIYDMDSSHGTYVNGEKIIAKNINPGDTISFGNLEFIYKEYSPSSGLPPVLDSLEPEKGSAAITNSLPKAPSFKTEDKLPASPQILEDDSDIPYIVYPLASDPKADYSEYIFEETDELYPIFKYAHGSQAVEVIILFKDKVFSVDYLPAKNGIYHVVGARPSSKQIEFPYLAKNEKVPFIEISSGNCNVSLLHNYQAYHLTDQEMVKSKHTMNLQDNDVVRLVNGDLEIYVRRVSAPPKVKSAPFFRRDKNLRKFLFLVLLLIFLPLFGLSQFNVDEELKKEKDPERIATILYKPKLNISKEKTPQKTNEAKPIKQKTPKEKVVTKPMKKEKSETKPVEKVTKTTPKDPGAKSAEKKQVVKKVKNPAPKAPSKKIAKSPVKSQTKSASKVPTTSASKSTSLTKTVRTRKATTPSSSQGHVDAYKSFNFKSTINKLVAKGGGPKGASANAGVATSEIGNTTIGGGVASNLKKADVGSDIGSLRGSTEGKLGESKGAEGLSAKKGIYTAGVPSDTVVLGSMDPDIIRQILRENIPQFRYCYQRALDQSQGKKISDIIPLVFTIGASGHVSKAGISGSTRLPGSVKGCVINVLRGIKFPAPLGGGTVDVKQPMNFYPERL